jgi:hypothetical protein
MKPEEIRNDTNQENRFLTHVISNKFYSKYEQYFDKSLNKAVHSFWVKDRDSPLPKKELEELVSKLTRYAQPHY